MLRRPRKGTAMVAMGGVLGRGGYPLPRTQLFAMTSTQNNQLKPFSSLTKIRESGIIKIKSWEFGCRHPCSKDWTPHHGRSDGAVGGFHEVPSVNRRTGGSGPVTSPFQVHMHLTSHCRCVPDIWCPTSPNSQLQKHVLKFNAKNCPRILSQ